MKITSKLFLSLSAILCVLSSFEGTISCGNHPDNGENYSAARSTVHLSQVVPLDIPIEVAPTPVLSREKPVIPTMSRDLEPNNKIAAPPIPLQRPVAARAPEPTFPTVTFSVPITLIKNEAIFVEKLRNRNTASIRSQQAHSGTQQESKKGK
jgi:hypothetical protein